jgi:hypothetical protein
MWECPECKAAFVQKNISHSCGNYSVEDFLKNKNSHLIRLFWFFIDEWEKIGGIKLHPVKTSVALLVKVRFCRINRISRNKIVGHLWLKQEVASRKFFKVEKIGNSDYLHYFEVKSEAFIDDEFLEYMKMAYEIGERKYLTQSEK